MTRLSSNSASHTGRATIATTSGSRSTSTIRANSSRDSYTTQPLAVTAQHQPE